MTQSQSEIIAPSFSGYSDPTKDWHVSKARAEALPRSNLAEADKEAPFLIFFSLIVFPML